MIDIHSHILPKVDDGAKSLQEALLMAQLAVENGIHAVVTTPHANLEEGTNQEAFKESYHRLNKALKEHKIPLVLYEGMEIYSTYQMVELLENGSLCTLNNTQYPLIEFGFHEDPWFVEDILEELLKKGYLPIIAHPERYRMVQQDISLVYHWITIGAKIQVNRGSLLGAFGRNIEHVSTQLLRQELVHFIATDCHSSEFRTPNLADVKTYIEKRTSREYAYLLLEDNPARMLRDEEVLTPFLSHC